MGAGNGPHGPAPTGGTAAGGAARALSGKPFIESESLLGGAIVRGRVVDVRDTATFPTPFGKASWLVGGRGYMFGHQFLKTALFVAPVDDESGETERCLLFYGDIAGQVRAGHLVEARVSRVRGQLRVRQLNDLTTSATIRAEDSMGCISVAVLMIVAFVIGAFLMSTIASGTLVEVLAMVAVQIATAALNVISVLLAGFGPVILIILALVWIARSIFR